MINETHTTKTDLIIWHKGRKEVYSNIDPKLAAIMVASVEQQQAEIAARGLSPTCGDMYMLRSTIQ